MQVAFDPRLYEGRGPLSDRRQRIVSILQAALAAVDPAQAVKRHLCRDGNMLRLDDMSLDLGAIDHVYVVGAGKAGASMAVAVEEVLGERLSDGYVNVKTGQALPTRVIKLCEAGHPVPDEAGRRGAARILELLRSATAGDLVLCLISGGASALLSLPADGISLDDLRAFTTLLLRSGATINELNTLRKHLELTKGGNLARAACPAPVLSLILSDVVGNPLDVIGSGPTVPDSSTFRQAWAILERYGLLERVPRSVYEHLQRGLRGEIADTPKPGDPAFQRVHNVIIGSNAIAASAAESAARALGMNTLLLTTYLQGEAREVGRVLAALAQELASTGRPALAPACVILGGETTVTLHGQGTGGRNQEMALAAALQIRGLECVDIVCLATDGSDGPTDASGALCDGSTILRAEALGMDAWACLCDNDAYPFFDALNDLLLTGPTHTNVNDLAFVFCWPRA